MPGKQNTEIPNRPHYSQEAKKRKLVIRLKGKTPGNSAQKKTNISFRIIQLCCTNTMEFTIELNPFGTIAGELKTYLLNLAFNK